MSFDAETEGKELLALRNESARAPSAALQARVFARLEQSLLLPPSTSPPNSAAQATAAAAKAKLAVVAAFAMGGAAGAGTYAAFDHEAPPRVVYVDRVVPPARAVENTARTVVPTTSTAEAPINLSAPAERHSPAKKPAAPPEQEAQPVDSATEKVAAPSPNFADLAEQQALLDRARAALGTGDALAALRILAEHGERYPGSVLAEEREGLGVKALAHSGKLDEARSRLSRFEATFPRSPLLPSLRHAVGAKP